MVERMSGADYKTLERFTRELFVRLQDGTHSLSTAHEHLMHTLTAWDDGNAQEVIPYMEARLREWKVKR